MCYVYFCDEKISKANNGISFDRPTNQRETSQKKRKLGRSIF